MEPKSTEELVGSLHAVLRQYAIGDDFKSLFEALEEVQTLREQKKSIQTSYETNLATPMKTRSDSAKKGTQHAQALDVYKRSLNDAIKDKKIAEKDVA